MMLSPTRRPHASWPSIALRLSSAALRRLVTRPIARREEVARRTVIYAAFKGMGDLLCAAPVIASELDAGVNVVLLLFAQLRGFVELIDLGPNRAQLQIIDLPVTGGWKGMRHFLQEMSRLAPDLVWYSPHSPLAVSSWRVPLLLWAMKQRYWPNAKLAGALSERCSWLFDVRVPADRRLPFRLREWTAYSMLDGASAGRRQRKINFNSRITHARSLPAAYDVLIHPGATANNRKWPAANYAQLIEQLPAELRLVVTGLPADVAELRALLPIARSIDYFSGSLEDAIALMARARVALTMDSGTMFFTTMLGVPTVTLFGPTDPAKELDSDADILQIHGPKHPCQPCEDRRCSQSTLLCMESITPGQVALGLRARLSEPASRLPVPGSHL
jgi:lipopolysaccharide heptosyltransferase II